MSSAETESIRGSMVGSPAAVDDATEPSTSSPTLADAATKNKDDASKCPRPPSSPSPEPRHCSICLQDLVNKSYSNTCCHEFCFGCLLEWSKVKPECPLCKASFRSIYHNIRSNVDYDEYVVPTPIPHLSIRLTTSDRFSPEVVVTTSSSTLGNHDYSLPELRFGSQRNISRSREVAHAIMRDRMRDPRVIQILQWTPSPSTESAASRAERFDFALHGQALPNDNPFHSDSTPELFGTALGLVNGASDGSNFSGYQSRRRRYDRSQWVSPFDSTLQPGTVFFPSVEYFQRHPSAVRRISPWLHRELTVLLGLTRSRPQLAFIYDLIISLLPRFDIRSREFRELLHTYFGSKTKQFQHEFYHYILSGMRMEEYDRVAQYGNTGSAVGSATRSANIEDNPASREPTVVTLDSDDDNGEVEIILSDDDESNPTVVNHTTSTTAANPSIRGEWLEDLIQNISNFPSPLSSPVLSNRSQSNFPADLSDSLEPFNPFDTMERNRRDNRFDPEMPILEPQIDLNNLSSLAGATGSAFRRTRTTDNEPSDHPTIQPPSARSRATETIGLLNSLRDIYMHPERHSQDVRDSPRPCNTIHDPIDGRRSPYPRPQPSIFSSASRKEASRSMPLSHGNLNTLDYYRLRRSGVEEQQPYTNSEHQLMNAISNFNRAEDSYRNRLRSSRVRSNPPVEVDVDAYCIGERSSCIHNPSTSAQVRIYPSPMDLSTSSSSSSRNNQNNESVIQSRPIPGHVPSSISSDNRRQNNQNQREEGECEFLGVHPVIKKPPLAVITLSSDDEDQGRRFKNERMDSLAAEPVERDVFMELFNSTFELDQQIPTTLSIDDLNDLYSPSTSGTGYAYQMPKSSRLPSKSLRSTSRHPTENPQKSTSNSMDFSSLLTNPVRPNTSAPANAAPVIAEDTPRVKKKSKKRKSERDGRKSRSDKRKSESSKSREQSLDDGKRKKRHRRHRCSKSRSKSSSGDSSTASECDNESMRTMDSSSKRKSVPSKKKKSKKCRRSKSRSSKKEHNSSQAGKSLFVAPSTSGTSSKLKSVVTKLDKPSKPKKSRVLVFSSSDSSSENESYPNIPNPKPPSVMLSFSKINKDCKRLRSVIASTSGSITSSPMTVSSSDAFTAVTALDLRSPATATALLHQTASYRRWESDDDEPIKDNDDALETETLLSVGYEDRSSSGSDTDNCNSTKTSSVWDMSRKRLTSDTSSIGFMNRNEDDLSLFPGTSAQISSVQEQDLPLPNSSSPESLDRFENVLINSGVVGSDTSSNELISLSPPTPPVFPERLQPQRIHHYDLNISYPERGPPIDDLLDLTVTVTRSGPSSPNLSPSPPVRSYWW